MDLSRICMLLFAASFSFSVFAKTGAELDGAYLKLCEEVFRPGSDKAKLREEFNSLSAQSATPFFNAKCAYMSAKLSADLGETTTAIQSLHGITKLAESLQEEHSRSAEDVALYEYTGHALSKLYDVSREKVDRHGYENRLMSKFPKSLAAMQHLEKRNRELHNGTLAFDEWTSVVVNLIELSPELPMRFASDVATGIDGARQIDANSKLMALETIVERLSTKAAVVEGIDNLLTLRYKLDESIAREKADKLGIR